MKRYIMTLIAFSLSVMAINGAEKSDGIDTFPYRDLIEKYVASSDFDKQKDIVIATRLLSKFSKYPYLIFGAFTQEDLPYFGKKSFFLRFFTALHHNNCVSLPPN